MAAICESPYTTAHEPLHEAREVPDHSFPGIEARFSLDTYLLRESMLATKARLIQTIPSLSPPRISGKSVWSSTSLSLQDITYQATSADVYELETALREFKETDASLNSLGPHTFRLPEVGPKLRKLSQRLHYGEGVVIIKGIQPERYDLEDSVIMFAGLSSYVGDKRARQSAHNDMITHLYSTQDQSIKDPRPGLSNHGLPFHNDHCDILALHVIQTARSGGTTRWASVGQIYNEIARSKPHVLEVLARNDWPHTTPSDEVKRLPLLFFDDLGHPFLSFTRFALTGLPTYPRSANAPKLSPEQADALDTLQYFAERTAVEVPQERGDIFLVNNRDVLHARDQISNTPGDPGRHLLRLCLRDSEYGRPIPPDLQRRWGNCFDSDVQAHGKWLLTREHDAAFVSNQRFDSAFPADETTGSHG